MTLTTKLAHFALGAMAIILIATATSMTSFSSWLMLYEPECPKELLK